MGQARAEWAGELPGPVMVKKGGVMGRAWYEAVSAQEGRGERNREARGSIPYLLEPKKELGLEERKKKEMEGERRKELEAALGCPVGPIRRGER
jgi:hypothetical protein